MSDLIVDPVLPSPVVAAPVEADPVITVAPTEPAPAPLTPMQTVVADLEVIEADISTEAALVAARDTANVEATDAQVTLTAKLAAASAAQVALDEHLAKKADDKKRAVADVEKL